MIRHYGLLRGAIRADERRLAVLGQRYAVSRHNARLTRRRAWAAAQQRLATPKVLATSLLAGLVCGTLARTPRQSRGKAHAALYRIARQLLFSYLGSQIMRGSSGPGVSGQTVPEHPDPGIVRPAAAEVGGL